MNREVMVSICGTQFDPKSEQGSEQAPIQVITTGDYYYKNEKHYVMFDEVLEGTDGIIKSTFRFSPEECFLKRTGAANLQMIFDRDNKTISNYITPFGTLVIGIDTNRIECNESDDRISLDIDYALDVNYEFMAECRLSVDIRPRGSRIKLQS